MAAPRVILEFSVFGTSFHVAIKTPVIMGPNAAEEMTAFLNKPGLIQAVFAKCDPAKVVSEWSNRHTRLIEGDEPFVARKGLRTLPPFEDAYYEGTITIGDKPTEKETQ